MEPMDNAGAVFTEMPSLHGPGSQTPSDPNKGSPLPTGGDKMPKPVGQAGAPTGGGMPGGAGAPGAIGKKPPIPPTQPQKTPEEQLNDDSITTLRQNITKVINRDEIEDFDTLLDTLLEEGWRSERLQDLMDYKESDNIESFIQDVVNKKYEKELKKEEDKQKEVQLPTTPPVGGLGSAPPTQSLKKPDNDLTGVNPPIPKASSNLNLTRGNLMGKQVLLKDGTLVIKEATNVSEVIEGISLARRKVEALTDKYAEAIIHQAGIEALTKKGGLLEGPGEPDGTGPFGGSMGGPMGGMGKGDNLEGIIGALKEAIQKLVDWLGKGKDIKKDEGLGAADASKLEDEMDKGEDAAGKGLDIFKKKEKKPDEKKDEEDKDEKKEKPPIVASDETDIIKEGVAGEKKPEKSEEAMKVQMGEKGPEKKKEDKKKDDKKADVTASDIIDRIQTRLEEMKKEANLYPFKDLNKQQVDNINATTATDQASTINSEIAGGKHSDSESIAPKDISETNPTVAKGGSPKAVNAPPAGKVSIEVAERIRKSSIENERSKAKLSVELASQQQLKGLIDNPLKEAFIKNMTEAGITKESAEAIAHNSFLDGYEGSQQLIMKEAFETFMNKDLDEFIKIAEVVKNHIVKEGSISSEDTEETREKIASINTSPLRGNQVNKDRKGEYKEYWQDVARERKGY